MTIIDELFDLLISVLSAPFDRGSDLRPVAWFAIVLSVVPAAFAISFPLTVWVLTMLFFLALFFMILVTGFSDTGDSLLGLFIFLLWSVSIWMLICVTCVSAMVSLIHILS